MGKRGPKPRFLDVTCPNEICPQFGIAGQGNITVYGTYQRINGKARKFICHTCGNRFCDRTNTPLYDLRTDEETVKLALKMSMRGMSVLGIAETVEKQPVTVSRWVSKTANHCEKVNDVVLRNVEAQKVEMDELWTFVGKKHCPGKMNMKTTALGSGQAWLRNPGWCFLIKSENDLRRLRISSWKVLPRDSDPYLSS
jgi:transposase-like protein